MIKNTSKVDNSFFCLKFGFFYCCYYFILACAFYYCEVIKLLFIFFQLTNCFVIIPPDEMQWLDVYLIA